jgi:hypothetical protein
VARSDRGVEDRLAAQQQTIDRLTQELKVMTDAEKAWKVERKKLEEQLEAFRKARDNRIQRKVSSARGSEAKDGVSDLTKNLMLRCCPYPVYPTLFSRTSDRILA